MKRPLLAVNSLLLLLSFVPSANAQDQPQFRFRLPCAQAVRMGLQKYFARYTAATHDQSTAGCIEAYVSYAHCRRSINDIQGRGLSRTRRGQLAQARRDLDTLAGACYDYIYLSAGGGTMWSEMEAYADADREDFLASLIASLRHPGGHSLAARRQAKSALRVAQRSLTTLRKPQSEGASTMEPAYARQYQHHTYPSARAAFARLQALIASLPDVPARRLAHEIQQELATPAQNLH